MAPHHNISSPCEHLDLFAPHTVYLVGLALALCLVLAVRRWRAPAPAPAPTEIPPTTQGDGTLASLVVEKSHLLYTSQPLPPLHASDPSFLDPFAKAGYYYHHPQPALTSGYLAAKAELENGQRPAPPADHQVSLPGLFAPEISLEPDLLSADDESEAQSPCIRRHSYPSKSDGRPAPLHQASLTDRTQHFADDQDIGSVWRRRTLTFKGRP